MTLVGLVVGIVAGTFVTRVLTDMLFGVTPRDPMSFVVVPVVLLFVSTLAAFVPARRAATIDPLRAMRG